MNRLIRAVGLVPACCLWLAGCVRVAPADDGVPAQALADVFAAPDGQDLPAAELRMAPAGLCEGQRRMSATVSWRVNDGSARKVRVELADDVPGQRKLFAAGGPRGQSVTGNWVVEGTRFHLVDDASGRELASLVATRGECAASSAEDAGEVGHE